MRISFIYPKRGVHPDDNNWMYFVAKELEKFGHEVILNDCDNKCDVILGMSIGVYKDIQDAVKYFPDIPLVTYNWDMHPLLQPEVGRWDEIGWDILLNNSIDVWTQTEYHANLAQIITNVPHYVMPICALDFEFKDIETHDRPYALMASRRVPYKGFELFEEGCKTLGIKSISRHPEYGNRDAYIRQLADCRVLVVASEEEANTPMSAYEGAFLGKPLLLSDIQPHREEWGDSATYFRNKDIVDFRKKLEELWLGDYKAMGEKAKKRAEEVFTLNGFATRIHERLCEVLS